MKKKSLLRNILALLVTIIFSVLVLYKINFSEMMQAFQSFDMRVAFLLIPAFMLVMTIRAKRWDILLPKHNSSFYNLYEIYMTSNLLNIFLPARAGDIFRGCYFGNKYNLSKLNIIGTVFAERIFDGLTVIAMLVIGIILYNKSDFAVKLAITAGIVFVLSFIILLIIYKYNMVDNICHFVKKQCYWLPMGLKKRLFALIDKLNPYLNNFIQGFKSFSNPKTLLSVAMFSILAWSADCVFIYCIVLAFKIKVSFLITLFILSFIALSTMIPSSSMYIGLYQYAFILACELFGLSKSAALSIALMQQGTTLIGYLIIGLFFMFRNHINLKDIKEDTSIE